VSNDPQALIGQVLDRVLGGAPTDNPAIESVATQLQELLGLGANGSTRGASPNGASHETVGQDDLLQEVIKQNRMLTRLLSACECGSELRRGGAQAVPTSRPALRRRPGHGF